jgi:Putative zinc-finger
LGVVTDRCDAVSGLIGRWHAGTLPDVDRSGFEQHLLCCPPCLRQHDKAALALAALPAASSPVPPTRFLDELRALLPKARV